MLVSLDAPNEKIKKHLRENITDAASDCVYEKIHNAVWNNLIYGQKDSLIIIELVRTFQLSRNPASFNNWLCVINMIK